MTETGKSKDIPAQELARARERIQELEGQENSLAEVLGNNKSKDALFEAIFKNARDGIAVFEALPGGGKRLLECNDRYCEQSGYSREELMRIGDPECLASIHGTPDEFELNKKHSLAYEPYTGCFSWNRPDKIENYIMYTTAFVFINGQSLKVGIDRDITPLVKNNRILEKGRLRMEEQLSEKAQAILKLTKELDMYRKICEKQEQQIAALQRNHHN